MPGGLLTTALSAGAPLEAVVAVTAIVCPGKAVWLCTVPMLELIIVNGSELMTPVEVCTETWTVSRFWFAPSVRSLAGMVTTS